MQRADFFVCSVRTFLFAACGFILFAACEFFYLQRADLFCSQCADLFIYLQRADLFCSQCEDLFSLQCTLFCEMCNVLLYGGILPGKMCPLWASVNLKLAVMYCFTLVASYTVHKPAGRLAQSYCL